jgi:uncharacterized repeat protein (TIGR03806 family)
MKIKFNAFVRRAPAKWTGALLALLGLIGLAYATLPAGLDTRPSFSAYVGGSLPNNSGAAMPATLSATGVYSNTAARTPHAGLIPYSVNSPLWTDNALKSRFIGVPDSTTVGFTATGPWTFPNGTVFVKNFDLVTDERPATLTTRRLETRILIRQADGTLRGATYKWNAAQTEATLSAGETETINVIKPNGSTASQSWLYPSPSQCLECHTTNAGMILGVKTAQLNGNQTYPTTGRTDNQLHTWHHIGLFNVAINDPPSSYSRMVDVTNTAATMEDRVKSYQDANCAHCHRPSGPGPKFDMRYESPITAPADGRDPIVSTTSNSGLQRFNILNSTIHQRDASTSSPMPPLARNVIDPRILDLYVLWGHYAYDVTSVNAISTTQLRVQFDRAVDVSTATVAANYAVNDGVTVSAAAMEPGSPNAVILTTSTLLADKNSYALTVNRVREAAAPQNPIWPNTQKNFVTLKHVVTPSAGAGGTITPSLPKFVADQVTTSFTLAPNAGFAIGTIGGSCPAGSLSGTTYTTGLINTNCTVSASFVSVPSPRTLTVAVTGGTWGNATSAPPGINCPGTCSASFADGTTVTLTRNIDTVAGGEFVGWTAPASCASSPASPTCAILMNAPQSAAARFTVNCRLDVDGDGVVRSSTDILMIARRILGMSGQPVASGGFNPGGNRTGEAAINAYILGRIAESRYDINLDGATDWRDAAILLRAFAGFKGNAVTDGLIPTNAQRKFWDQPTPAGASDGISQYLSAVCAAGTF